MIKAEYIWIDGTKPTAQVRSKTKILEVGEESLRLCGDLMVRAPTRQKALLLIVCFSQLRFIRTPFEVAIMFLCFAKCRM